MVERQELVEIAVWPAFGDALESQCQPGEGIDVVHLGCLQKGRDCGPCLPAAVGSDPPPLNGSTLKYGFDHEGGPQWQTSDTSPTRSSRSFGRLRFCAAKAWRWRMPFARSAFPN